MTRQEHLAWAKSRALAHLNQGDLCEAFTSMYNDLELHDELNRHPALEVGMTLLVGGCLRSEREMRIWIEEFR